MATKPNDIKSKRIEPEIAVGSAPAGFTPPPQPTRGGGSKPKYPFDDLANVGDFFSVKNKDRRQMTGPVASANKRWRNEAKDGEGKTITVQEREFYAVDVDATTAKNLKGTPHEGAKALLVRSK